MENFEFIKPRGANPGFASKKKTVLPVSGRQARKKIHGSLGFFAVALELRGGFGILARLRKRIPRKESVHD